MFQNLKLSCSYVWSRALCYSPEIKEKAPHKILCLFLKFRRLELNEFLQNWKPDKCLYKLLLLVSSYSLFINSSWQGKREAKQAEFNWSRCFCSDSRNKLQLWAVQMGYQSLHTKKYAQIVPLTWSLEQQPGQKREPNTAHFGLTPAQQCAVLPFLWWEISMFSGKTLSPCIPIARCLRLDWQRLPIKSYGRKAAGYSTIGLSCSVTTNSIHMQSTC